jgi:hypothetical protein
LSRAFFGSFDFNSIKRVAQWCGSCAVAHSKSASLGPDQKEPKPLGLALQTEELTKTIQMYKYKKSKKKKLLLCNQSPANQVVFFVFDIEI